MNDQSFDKEALKQFLENRFDPSIEKTEEQKIIESIMDLTSKHQKDSIGSLLLDAAMMISKQFEFKEISIGLKDKSDGLFKYAVALGCMPAIQEAHKKIAYTLNDMKDSTKYPNIVIGRISELIIDSPEEELKTFNRPALIHKKRNTIDEFLEGDYIDLFMYGGGDEMIGWVEIAAPKDGKIPDKIKMLRLELTVTIISRILWERVYARESMKPMIIS